MATHAETTTSDASHVADELPATGASVWAGLLGPPVLWSMDLCVRYSLVPFACLRGGDQRLLHGLSIAFFLAVMACALICYLDWRSVGVRVPAGEEAGPITRRQFVAAVGMLSSLLFGVIVIAEALPGFFLDPCIQ